jgi:invasion protein IalB
MGARGARMRFVSGLAQFTTGWGYIRRFIPPASDRGEPAFSAHSWLYCRRDIGYQAALRSHAPAVFQPERADILKTSVWAGRGLASGANKGIKCMNHCIASARPLRRARVATVAVAGLLAAMLAVPVALAQTPPPAAAPKAPAKPAATKPAPAAKPAEPPAPAAQPDTQAADPQLMYSPWMKVCGKGPDTNNKQVCVITKDGRLENGMPVAIVQLFEPEGEAKVLRVTVPLGMQLQHGTRMLIDQSPPAQQAYKICFPVGCMSDYPVTDDMIAKMKKGQMLTIQAINMQGTPISLPMPLVDFGKAYDGPATDPKVFEEQQRKLQEELQKKAEEARKKLEGQQPSAQAPAAAPAQKK